MAIYYWRNVEYYVVTFSVTFQCAVVAGIYADSDSDNFTPAAFMIVNGFLLELDVKRLPVRWSENEIFTKIYQAKRSRFPATFQARQQILPRLNLESIVSVYGFQSSKR